jgi:putative two-component system response regulator
MQASPADLIRRIHWGPMRLLLVDDDPGIRELLRVTFEAVDVDLDEAADADSALDALLHHRPDAIVLDVSMPGTDGLALCRRLKHDPLTADIPVVLLTGSDLDRGRLADEAGADAYVLKPFSPLDLLATVERVTEGRRPPSRSSPAAGEGQQLLLYAHDLRHLLELERAQRRLVEAAYRETVGALAAALESKDVGTGAHSQRVQHYALELAGRIDSDLGADSSVQVGFLLHDVGKIGIPDQILLKPGPLSETERRTMQTHTVLGEQMLGGVAYLQGEGIRIVRSHHERWDGAGYPDGLAGDEIPLGARIFAVADALDAMTSDRPYRSAGPWQDAKAEIAIQASRQFDPRAVSALFEADEALRAIQAEFAAA